MVVYKYYMERFCEVSSGVTDRMTGVQSAGPASEAMVRNSHEDSAAKTSVDTDHENMVSASCH